ncbi:sulfurtransferase [Solilutibacter silvestris]|uniref:Putative sulfurtransferase n=1 Tax=Solilutibacter silvestris TaxID=1645665 RepID=A0A2K1PY92_9GAMM|nr:sulfurtransferase [Lysobacter silvestris]PNS07759.1 putative sulfurtransferase [Lysobacter silvestris]
MDAVLNIAAYRFVAIADVDAVVAQIGALARDNDLRGTVLVAPEGINLFLAGGVANIEGFLATLQEDARFAAIEAKRSWSAHVPFAKLKIKRKQEIIAFAGRAAGVGVQRAPAVEPVDLARWLRDGHDDDGRKVVMLDTRNREEVAYGSFSGALTLPIDNFNDLPVAVDTIRGQLTDATVVSFCTGGVRCEKAAPWLESAGIDHVFQLEGGILRYFDEVGGEGYDGRCFVFDERVALDPALKPLRDAAVEMAA